MLTRLQARPVQPTGLEIPTRANSPGRFVDSRQDNAVVSENNDVGNRSILVANGNLQTGSDFTVLKCNNARCKTCPNLITSSSINSNVTGKIFNAVNLSSDIVNCHSQNLVYMLICKKCNLQYVGETTIPLHKRINIHRTSKSGCENFINHFNSNCKGSGFNIQILEKLEGSGYNALHEVDDVKRKVRLSCEDKWIKKLRTIFPYGLNDRVRNSTNTDESVGYLFPPMGRTNQRPVRSRNRNHLPNPITTEAFFADIYKALNDLPKSAFNFIRKVLDKCCKKLLKKIAQNIINTTFPCVADPGNYQAHCYILDIIDTKIFKPSYKSKSKLPPENLCIVQFNSKAIEMIRLPSILKNHEVIKLLPDVLQKQENIPVVTYRLGKTIRNKIVNYKNVVTSLFFQEGSVDDILNMDCECSSSEFCDSNHKHVITGKLGIVNNVKLRKLLSKGPNYREKRTTNFNKAKKDVIFSINNLFDSLKNKYKLDDYSLTPWKDKVIEVLNQKIFDLKKSVHVSQVTPVLDDPSVLEDLASLQDKYVIVPIDKAANNFAFICKKYYITILLKELGYPDGTSNTYKLNLSDLQQIKADNIEFCEHLGYKISEEEKTLPIIYWIPKMHKSPVGQRFIIASKLCTTKKLSRDVSKVFKLLFQQTRSFHDKSHFYFNYNKFWVVENSTPILDKIHRTNAKRNAKCISTFDFTTLCTKIPHQSLIDVLLQIIDFTFSAGKKKYINVARKSAYWSSKKDNSFSIQSLKLSVRFLVSECHFSFGNLVFTQVVGIPMGIDPAPFWANLYLYHYEKEYLSLLIHTDKCKASKFHGVFRFIDDLCAINDSDEFLNSHQNIYPPVLELKREHHGEHATFLDLDLSIKDGLCVYKLFDKRDAFPFFIVRMPYISSNIPSFIFYGTFKSEVLRIAKNTLIYEDFKTPIVSLLTRMVNQGGCCKKLVKCIVDVAEKHICYFESFSKFSGDIASDITKEM